MAQIALAQKPLEITVASGANVFAAKGRFLVAVSHGVGTMTLGAVVTVDQSAGGYRFGMGRQRVDASVILFGDAVPMGSGCRAE